MAMMAGGSHFESDRLISRSHQKSLVHSLASDVRLEMELHLTAVSKKWAFAKPFSGFS